MVREFRLWAEFSILVLVQLLGIGLYLSILFPASAQTQTVPSSATMQPVQLGTFLSQYPPDKSAELAPTQLLWQQQQSGITAHRLFKARKSFEVMQKAGESFGSECRGLGGKLQTSPEPGAIMYAYTLEKRLTRFDHVTHFCVSAEGRPVGGLFAYLFGGSDQRSHVALFLISADHVAQLFAAHARARDRDKRNQVEWAIKEEAKARRIADWRTKLQIGTETHCGPVIELRGPMVLVAYRSQAGWLRREQLYPPFDKGRCWEFSGL